jgi:very-short-patch-repair endonuclease
VGFIGRYRYLEGMDLKILRFSDKEVFENTQDVLERMWEYL